MLIFAAEQMVRFNLDLPTGWMAQAPQSAAFAIARHICSCVSSRILVTVNLTNTKRAEYSEIDVLKS